MDPVNGALGFGHGGETMVIEGVGCKEEGPRLASGVNGEGE